MNTGIRTASKLVDGSFRAYIRISSGNMDDDRIAIHPFSEELAHLGYAASDYILMPSVRAAACA